MKRLNSNAFAQAFSFKRRKGWDIQFIIFTYAVYAFACLSAKQEIDPNPDENNVEWIFKWHFVRIRETIHAN